MPRAALGQGWDRPLPSTFHFFRLGNQKRVGDLSHPWRRRAEPLNLGEKRRVFDLFRDLLPPPSTVIIPEGVDGRFVLHADLSQRLRIVLDGTALEAGGICVVDFERLQGRGHLSLLEFMCIAELGLSRLHMSLTGLISPIGDVDTPKADTRKVSNASSLCREGLSRSTSWVSLVEATLALATDLRFGGKLTDIIHPDLVMSMSDSDLRTSLNAIAVTDCHHADDVPSQIILHQLEEWCTSLTERTREIVEARLCSDKPTTLGIVGQMLDITRERVRQIQAKQERRIQNLMGNKIQCLANAVVSRLPPIIKIEELQQCIENLFPEVNAVHSRLARQLFKQSMGYTPRNGLMLKDSASKLVQELREGASTCVDDVGIIDEEQLKARLPNDQWVEFWPMLLHCTELHEINGYPCLRDSAKARVKTTLMNIGEPATKEVIAARSGFGATQVGGALSNIDSVVRADKSRWGLAEWIDDEYDGIVGEILQRIRSNGGCVSVEKVVRELPERFGVSESSVRMYLSTPQFEVVDGDVSEVSEPRYQLQPLGSVISDEDEHGQAVWDFVVEDRFFSGHSLTGVPFEIAAALGCTPGNSIAIQVAWPTGCRDLSLSWRHASTTKASIGYIGHPLTMQNLKQGDKASVILVGEGVVEVRRKENPTSTRSAEALLERLKDRRRWL